MNDRQHNPTNEVQPAMEEIPVSSAANMVFQVADVAFEAVKLAILKQEEPYTPEQHKAIYDIMHKIMEGKIDTFSLQDNIAVIEDLSKANALAREICTLFFVGMSNASQTYKERVRDSN